MKNFKIVLFTVLFSIMFVCTINVFAQEIDRVPFVAKWGLREENGARHQLEIYNARIYYEVTESGRMSIFEMRNLEWYEENGFICVNGRVSSGWGKFSAYANGYFDIYLRITGDILEAFLLGETEPRLYSKQ